MKIKVGKKAIKDASKKLSNWGRWGADDQIGTLNFATPSRVASAAKLIKKGKAFSLGIPLDQNGPQTGLFGGRFNPIHQMLATGTDAIAGRHTHYSECMARCTPPSSPPGEPRDIPCTTRG